MKNKNFIKLSLIVWLVLVSVPAWAMPELSLEIIAQKEVVIQDSDGTLRTEKIDASDAAPGEQILYTIRYRNTGTSAARNVSLDNPVPEGTRYVANSVWGEGSDIVFAISEDTAFKPPAELTYQNAGGEVHRAEPEQYKVIRWVIEEIPAGSEGEAGFEVKVD